MENKNQETLAVKVIATLDAILNKMADVLNDSFEPGDPESMKLLREFRATMNSRRTWVKFYGLSDGNEETSNSAIQKVETSASNRPVSTIQKPVIFDKQEDSILDGIVFKGIKCKSNKPIPHVDLISGLVCPR